MKCYKLDSRMLAVVKADITRLAVDAIVNPANSLMYMGGGVAGAIKRAGGREIEEEALRKAPVPVGKAVSTGAGRLKAKYIIHAPTMPKPAMRIPVENVALAVLAALSEASKLGVESVAFPAMGAGVGGLSVEEALAAMLSEILKWRERSPTTIILVAYGQEAYEEMVATVTRVLGVPVDCPASLNEYL